MPRARDRQARRIAGLCVECDRHVSTARCPTCRARERRRAARTGGPGPGRVRALNLPETPRAQPRPARLPSRPESARGIALGGRVRHPAWGVAVVTDIQAGSGSGDLLSLRLADGSTRRLAEGRCRLEALDG